MNTMKPPKHQSSLDDAVKKDGRSGRELPDGDTMTKVALEILNHSETALPLVEMVAKKDVKITVIKTPQEVSYIPQSRQIFIGVTAAQPTPPPRFVLLLAGALRETWQELDNWTHPGINEPLDKHLSVSTAKEADKVAHICAIAYELSKLERFAEYRFLDEVKKMGHSETLGIFLANI